jgi:penicillin-binding protein 2
MQYLHPDWDKTARRKAWRNRLEAAIILAVVAAGLYLLVRGLRSGPIAPPADASPAPTPTDSNHIQVPSPEPAARAFLDAWQNKNYDAMYALLSGASRTALPAEEFRAFYEEVRVQATVRSLEYRLLSVDVTPTDATVAFEVTLHTILVGDITESARLPLKAESDGWKVAWDGQSVLPQLENGNRLAMHREAPARGNILDRNGLSLAAEMEMVAIGVVPGEITDEETVLARLSTALDLPRELIRRMYADAAPDQYVPIGDAAMADIVGYFEALGQLGGVYLNTSTARYYYGGGVGEHVVGYTSKISSALLADYQALGYNGNETVGATGIERSAETDLAGRAGGTLYVTAADGTPLSILAKADPLPARDVTLTLDRDLQAQIERTVLGPYNGAAVVLNRNTGEVLAMVSSKRFDSNLFTPGSFNGQYALGEILNDSSSPLLNRATKGLYPLGSVFKIITMAAGLQSGLFTPNTVYDDATGIFNGPGGFVGTDWTIEKDMKPHGRITLEQCLVQSCNPCFWNVGLTLYNKDPDLVPNMAKAFGLGSPTGIPGLDENAGLVPDEIWKLATEGTAWMPGDALNQAIGQGMLQVTPLQVADFVAAVGNGGTLYRPQVIRSIAPPGGDPIFSLAPVVRGKLPVSAANLEAIQRAMRGVVNDPKGTARARFYGIADVVKTAGKTGTAQSGSADPHSWFVAYTTNQVKDKPDIAVAVIAEYAGEGSTYAARMARRVIEIYFLGHPIVLYPWEATFGLRGTATPEVTGEPSPTDTPLSSG